ncbi:hypothetical protein L195_g059481, partial [Trifolium pratense]
SCIVPCFAKSKDMEIDILDVGANETPPAEPPHS